MIVFDIVLYDFSKTLNAAVAPFRFDGCADFLQDEGLEERIGIGTLFNGDYFLFLVNQSFVYLFLIAMYSLLSVYPVLYFPISVYPIPAGAVQRLDPFVYGVFNGDYLTFFVMSLPLDMLALFPYSGADSVDT